MQSLVMRDREVGTDDIAAANLIGRLHRTGAGCLMRWNHATPFWDWKVVQRLQRTGHWRGLRHQKDARCLIFRRCQSHE